jgi:hypothetical protein
VRDVRLDVLDAVLREEEGSQSREEGEVAQLCYIIVGEVDGVVFLEHPLVGFRELQIGNMVEEL